MRLSIDRLWLLLSSEFKLFRTAVPIHAVAILQPTVMYLLMAVILVHPTFDMNVARPTTAEGRALVDAMREVGSPIGLPYINPILVDRDEGDVTRQIVAVEDRSGKATAVQYYGLIDSNLVKNFRNRLTAAGLRLWNAELGDHAVTVEEHPWLPRDVPYTVYFGMALLTMTAFLAASILGAVLTAQDFEFGTFAEYRLAPAPVALILGARLTRLVLSALLSVAILLVAVGLVNDMWPSYLWGVALVLLPVAVIAACLGVVAGLLFRRTIPAFLIGLVASFVGWIMGSAFGLAAGFGGWYERISRLTPFTHAVELLFPYYYGAAIGHPLRSGLVLVLFALAMLALTASVYRWRLSAR
jgi:ABC-type multidrug transport system permease subunit